jgi:D-sedoheptulose 7-phosphate isomerase
MAGSIAHNSATYFEQAAVILRKLDHAAVDAYCDLVFDAWRNRRRVLVFGNGGSAYTASHHVTDYIKTAAVDGARRLEAISLVDNLGMLTALANDSHYDETLIYPLQTFARPGDLAIAISCSGNSPNVVRACEWAKGNGLKLVAITGFAGGKIGAMAHVHVNVPSDNYGIIEDVQMSVGHVAAQSLKSRVSALPAAQQK